MLKENTKTGITISKITVPTFYKRAVMFSVLQITLVYVVTQVVFGSPFYAMEKRRMIWNTFLSLLSFIYYCLFRAFYSYKRKALTAFFFFMWILFLPNAFYMITDLKYISEWSISEYSLATFEDPIYISSWAYLCGVLFPVLVGISFGIAGVYDFEKKVLSGLNMVIREVIVLFIMFISGFAICIGRFARVNSWDVAQPKFLFEKIVPYISKEGLLFSFIFAAISWFCYTLFKGLIMVFASKD